ncbi:hypothetical protein ACHAW5_004621 [Stephanodiscus triporus]|uniref:SnoaL-like domain-containing protein n=1 Tax=Stephanodiscus triporus TaxID=2934178 RepID=A0ABD3QTR1_9STRA
MRPHESNRTALAAQATTTTCRRNRGTLALALFASSSRASSIVATTAAFSPPPVPSSFFFGASTSTSSVVRDVSPPFLEASSSSEVTSPPRHPRHPPPPPPTTTTTTSAPPAASVVVDFYDALDDLYDRSSSIKCPFFRRRAADLIDDAATVGRFLLVRHKSLPVVSDLLSPSYDDDGDGGRGRGNGGRGEIDVDENEVVADALLPVPPGCKPLGRHIGRDGAGKARHATISDVARRIEYDWTSGPLGPTKGYYITGRLDSTMYRDDCLFTGPDPDMPVRGLRKYLGAASHLFDARRSDARLLSLAYDTNGGECGRGLIEARWRLGGTIMLPWRPTVEPWTGTTRYHLDDEGLIKLHEERWDISVWRAFVCTLIPSARTWRIWRDADGTAVRV